MSTKRGARDAKEFLEHLIGPMSVGRLIRAYRFSNEMTLEDLAEVLDVTVGFISNVETGKKKISLFKTLEIAERLGEFKELYAQAWFEEVGREAGYEVDVSVKKMVG